MRRFACAMILALAALAGCRSEEDNIRLVKVSGTVTKNGKRLAKATVAFFPVASNKYATPGIDETGPEGTYMVRFKNRTGVAPGKYKVTVTPAMELPPDVANLPDEIRNDPLMLQTGQEARGEFEKKGKVKAAQAITKNEFDSEVPEDVQALTLDFDVKAKG